MTDKSRKIAVIDMGTHSFLMLVAEHSSEGRIRILSDESAVPRLGEGLRTTGKISSESLLRSGEVLKQFMKTLDVLSIHEVFCVGTSAMREASNQNDVISHFSEITKHRIEILSPQEEARLAYQSVTVDGDPHCRCLVADIGGGSTEIAWGVGLRFKEGQSLRLGTLQLLESCLISECPSFEDISRARHEIDTELSHLHPLNGFDRYIGTAGSFTLLAAVDRQLQTYSPESVAGHRLDVSKIGLWVDQLRSLNRWQRQKLCGMDPRRVDVILPGALIIEGLMKKLQNTHFEVLDRGIRFGKLFDEVQNFVPPILFFDDSKCNKGIPR